MIKKLMMTPSTLNTILNTAPMIIQGAGKLLKLIREREDKTPSVTDSIPMTIEGLKQQIKQLEAGLHENNRSDVELVRLIEQLARQNESLAETLQQTFRKVSVLTYIAVFALATSLIALILLFQ